MTQMNISMIQTHKHREQTCGCQGRERIGEERIGSSRLADANYYIQDGLKKKSYCLAQGTIFKVLKHNGKEYEKENICITQSLCCTAEINITLYINYT